MDVELRQALGPVRGVRMMDEWEFAFDKVADAEQARAAIEDKIAFLELELNPQKVTLREGPVPLSPPWVTRLKSLSVGKHHTTSRDLVTLFDTAFELAAEQRTKGVLNWAISRIMSSSFAWPAWRELEPILLQAAASEPGSLGRVLRVLHLARAQGHSLHPWRIAETLATVLRLGATRAHWSEVAWAVWGHILLGIPLDSTEASALAETDDSIVVLCALDAYNKRLINPQHLAAAFQRWTPLVSTASLDTRDWLLAYEATVKQWIPVTPNPVVGDPHYGPMLQAGVHFYRAADDPGSLMLGHKNSAPDWLTSPLGYP